MKIIYSNTKTQKLCEDYKQAVRTFGNQVAERLMDLLDAIDAFPNLLDFSNGLPQYRLHSLTAGRDGQYSLVISKSSKWRLIIYPLDEDEQLLKNKSNEKLMLSKSVAVEVVEVSEHYA